MGTSYDDGSGGGPEVYYTFVNYSEELEEIGENIAALEETQEQIELQLADTKQAIIEGTGVISALFGMLMGFLIIRELLKVWLE